MNFQSLLTLLPILHLCSSAVVAFTPPNKSDGKRTEQYNNNPHARIIGGTDAIKEDYPWFVSSDYTDCGASLIHPEFIITAAHCEFNFHNDITIGKLCRQDSNCDQTMERIEIEKKFKHPNYERTNSYERNDFMLIKLKQRSEVQPIKMDDGMFASNYTSGKPLWTLGFGDTNADPYIIDASHTLKHVKVNYVTSTECNLKYDGKIDSSMMCAADIGKDACQGDSGGPLYDKENDVLVGIVSWGMGCADSQFPGVYASIAGEWSWIQKIICENHSSDENPSICDDFPTSSPTLSQVPTQAPTTCEGISVSLELKTDESSSETSWELLDTLSNEIVDKSIVYEKNTLYTIMNCVPVDSCYDFSIQHLFGDGLGFGGPAPNPNAGGFELFVDNELVLSNTGFDSAEKYIFGGLCPPPPTEKKCNGAEMIQLNLTTDSYGSDISWSITNTESDEVLYFKDNYADEGSLYFYEYSLCLGCYTFRIDDKFNDGIAAPGGYTLSTSDQQFSGGDFEAGEEFNFGALCPVQCNSDEMAATLVIDSVESEFTFVIRSVETDSIVKKATYHSGPFDNVEIPLCLPRQCYELEVYNLANGDKQFDGSYGIVADENDKAMFSCPKDHVDISITINSSEEEFAYVIREVETNSIVQNDIHEGPFDSFEFSLVLPLSCYELEVYKFKDTDEKFDGFYKVLIDGRDEIIGFNYGTSLLSFGDCSRKCNDNQLSVATVVNTTEAYYAFTIRDDTTGLIESNAVYGGRPLDNVEISMCLRPRCYQINVYNFNDTKKTFDGSYQWIVDGKVQAPRSGYDSTSLKLGDCSIIQSPSSAAVSSSAERRPSMLLIATVSILFTLMLY